MSHLSKFATLATTTFAAVLAAAVLLASPAAAHTTMTGSDPEPDSALTDPPRAITLTFNEQVDPRFVTIAARAGTANLGRLRVGQGSTRSAIVAAVPTSGPRGGESDSALVDWVVNYRVASSDGHPVEGTLRFRAPATSAASAPDSEKPGEQRPQRDERPESELGSRDSNREPAWLVAGAAVVGLGIGTWFVVRSRRRQDA